MSYSPTQFLADLDDESLHSLVNSFDFKFLDDASALELASLIPEINLASSSSGAPRTPNLFDFHEQPPPLAPVHPVVKSEDPIDIIMDPNMFSSGFPLGSPSAYYPPFDLDILSPAHSYVYPDAEQDPPFSAPVTPSSHHVTTTHRSVPIHGPVRPLRVHDSKHVFEIMVGLAEQLSTVRDAILEHRTQDSRSHVVVLTERLSGKRLSDTGSYEPNQMLDVNIASTMAAYPQVDEVFLYDVCQGQPLRGEGGVHTRLCHPKSSICEAHRKQMERAKVKRPPKERPITPEGSVDTLAAEESKRRKRMDECPMTFEVLLGDACRMGQDLLTMLTAYTPMRFQIRTILSSFQSRGFVGHLSMRWPRQWLTDRLIGFNIKDTVVKFMHRAPPAEVAVRSQLPDILPLTSQFSVSLDGQWKFDNLMSIGLLCIASPVPVSIKILGASRNDVVTIAEFTSSGHIVPVLFAYNLNGQKQQHHSALVQLEEPATGRIFFQQLIKFIEPDIMENDMACQWFSLAERKLSLEGEVEPNQTWRIQIRKIAADPMFSMHMLFAQSSDLVKYGFSVRDTVNIAAELQAESLMDHLVESTQFCVRPASKK